MKLYISKTLGINSFDGFHLLQDHLGTSYNNPWDDFGFIVTFNLYFVINGEKQKVDSLKLLIDGVQNTANYLFENGIVVSDKIYEITDTLTELDAVSLGEKSSYYKKINFVLGEDKKSIDGLLSLLGDASYFISNEEIYSKYDGYGSTIMRNGETAKSLIKKGYHLSLGTYAKATTFTLPLDQPSDTIESIEFKFDISKEIAKTNINLLIGENGTGKSHILRKISEVITGVAKNSQSWPFFHKVVVAAYSPFENFYTRGQILDVLDQNHEKKSSKKEKKRRDIQINKYSYIGFKDDNNNFNLNWPKAFSVKSMAEIIQYDEQENWWTEETRLKTLKDTLKLSMDFDSIAVKLKSNDDFFKFEDDSYLKFADNKHDIDETQGLFFLKNDEPIKLSSGQEIFSYMIPSLVAEIEEESLLIIDEPELYLHPTLEIGLIDMLKKLLKETNSSAIIATHSALLAREVARDGTVILRKQNGFTIADSPTIQTYGESLEVIIGEAFDDYSTVKPFQRELDKAISKTDASTEEIISEYSSCIGDEALTYLSASTIDEKIDFEER
ncbi:ATP-binding protein [Vibrio parahaemolyticus]|uniref:AAA family ATPase n=1 Tax=Vibrio parahaemolyticus TaxID=670 RepID=UPI00226B77FD|nr:AAA family ATPase [Vibrio parahaemolyticus]MCX8793813.1 ATP-binding protein [Vibrio parahaemolyticus]